MPSSPHRVQVLGACLALALSAVGCGSSSTSSGSAPSSVAGHPTALWTAALSGRSGRPRGATGGRGVAIVALHGPTVLCWRFAHLHGFTSPTGARLQLGLGPHAAVVIVLRSGTVFHHQGCRHVAAAVSGAIGPAPQRYAVSITSAAYPAGAVRGLL